MTLNAKITREVKQEIKFVHNAISAISLTKITYVK